MKRYVIIPILALGLLLLGFGLEPPPIQAEQILTPDANEKQEGKDEEGEDKDKEDEDKDDDAEAEDKEGDDEDNKDKDDAEDKDDKGDKGDSKVTNEKEGAEAEATAAESDTAEAGTAVDTTAATDTTGAAAEAKAETVTEEGSVRYYLYMSTPKEGVGEAAPADLQAAEDGLTSMVEGIGGKLHGFFWGLGNGRNYITISVPNDSKIVQSMYSLRKAGAPLAEYEEIELMTNADLIGALGGGTK